MCVQEPCAAPCRPEQVLCVKYVDSIQGEILDADACLPLSVPIQRAGAMPTDERRRGVCTADGRQSGRVWGAPPVHRTVFHRLVRSNCTHSTTHATFVSSLAVAKSSRSNPRRGSPSSRVTSVNGSIVAAGYANCWFSMSASNVICQLCSGNTTYRIALRDFTSGVFESAPGVSQLCPEGIQLTE